MIKIFAKKPVLSDQDYHFQVETYKWLLRNFGGKDFFEDTRLVLPTPEFFPEKVASPEDVAESIFLSVKKHAGMEEWPCKLKKQKEGIDPKVHDFLIVRNAPVEPYGTYSVNKLDDVVITYNPQLVSSPIQLVATLAHELAHYLTGTCEESPPGGWDNWEFATDIAAVFMGFGVFMANTAF